MSRNYDNWERLVAAVIKRDQIWKLCHENSRSSSFRSSLSSDLGSSFGLISSSFSSPSFDFFYPKIESKLLPFKYLARIETSVKRGANALDEVRTEVVRVDGSPFPFSLQELLTAPSFIIGDEMKTFETAYLVWLDDTTFVVKRMVYVASKFERWANYFGSIEHDNIVSMRGYCVWNTDVFGFFDYFPQGSVHSMLHGKNGMKRVDLDWEARFRIAVGVARGLSYIHMKTRRLGHDNIKSSNVFLNWENYGCIAIEKYYYMMDSKNHAPEVIKNKKSFSHASDVYSFGILLIELMSGKSPLMYRHKKFVDWAIHNARDEWTTMVFDKKVLKDPLGMRGLEIMLVVALSCLKEKPENRPDMNYVQEEMESLLEFLPIRV